MGEIYRENRSHPRGHLVEIDFWEEVSREDAKARSEL
jgi:hypothetical protein